MNDCVAGEMKRISLRELHETLQAFSERNSHHPDLATRFIALRAVSLKKEIMSVLNRRTDDAPEVAAGMRELRLSELLDERRRLSTEMDALATEERGLLGAAKKKA